MRATEEVLASGQVLQGPVVNRLEQRLCKSLDLEHCVTLGSGTDAVSFAIAALGLPEGSRIAAPTMTFVASASGIVHNRCIPVFVDVDPETMLMDEMALLDLIARRAVDAIVVVHLYGQLQNLDSVGRAAEEAGIPIIEDAAQALGATRHGKAPGRYGVATCVSFDPTKVIGAFGSGGALLTDDGGIAESVRRLRYHGHDGKGRYLLAGFNSQMHSIQAALLDVKFDHWKEWQSQRRTVAERFIHGLSNIGEVTLLKTLPGNVHNYHKFVFHAEKRDGLSSHLAELGIQTKIHYPVPLHQQPEFHSLIGTVRLPRAEAAARSILSLPIYPELTEDEIERVVAGIRSYYGH